MRENISNTTIVEFSKSLESVFHIALRVKTLGMMGNHILEFIWPDRDSVFDNSLMEEQRSGSTNGCKYPTEQKVGKVKLVLVPGLRVYSYDRKLVDYCGFTNGDEEGLEKVNAIAKAVVLAV